MFSCIALVNISSKLFKGKKGIRNRKDKFVKIAENPHLKGDLSTALVFVCLSVCLSVNLSVCFVVLTFFFLFFNLNTF